MSAGQRFPLTATLLVTALVAVGCAQPQRPLYHWGTYEKQLYDYLRGDKTTPAVQLEALLRQAENATKAGEVLPPGFQAHLGAVYLKAGNLDNARKHFELEARAFPESSQFMAFLIRNMGKK